MWRLGMKNGGPWRTIGGVAAGTFQSALVLIVVAAPSNQLSAQEYVARVTFANGPHSSVFSPGDIVVISYMLDPLAADSNADPQRGNFSNAVTSLSVSFVDLDVSAVAGPAGPAQTFDNNVQPSGEWNDTIFLIGGPITESSLLGGEAITFLELDFGTRAFTPPAEPLMISSDALPLSKLTQFDSMRLFIGTDSGFTQVALESSCTPGPTVLCLNNDRFKVEVEWENFAGNNGPGQVVPGGTDDSSNLWFFDPDNWEMLIKVLDGCGFNEHYWVFFAATTNVEFTVTVTDTQEDEQSTYFNPLGQPADAITDTIAFATCP